jgi:hypothetical protein
VDLGAKSAMAKHGMVLKILNICKAATCSVVYSTTECLKQKYESLSSSVVRSYCIFVAVD